MKNSNDTADKLLDDIKRLDEELEALPEVTHGTPKKHNHVSESNMLKKAQDKIWPGKTILINMELRTGMHRSFIISTKNDNFRFQGGTYIIDNELKYYNVDSKCYALDYHQDISIPIKRKIPVTETKKVIQHSGMIETEAATNPYLIEEFIKSKVIEGAMKGQQIEEALKNLKMAAYIAAISSTGLLLLFVVKTGMLSSIKIPGLG